MDITPLFELTIRPDESRFFKSQDPHDQRSGAVVSSKIEDYAQSKIVIISCSQDQGVQRNRGRGGADRAPTEIRSSFYRLTVPEQLKTKQLFDLGDTAFTGSLEEIHERHFAVVSQVLKEGKKVIVIGGGNDISYPDFKAVAATNKLPIAVNVDAHLDIRVNGVCNSGTPYRQLIDEKVLLPINLYEFCVQKQANSVDYIKHALQMNINLLWVDELQEKGLLHCLENQFGNLKGKPLFLGFDMDSVKSADAPGVSASSPTGLTAEQAVRIVEYLSCHCSAELLEISEVNPKYDIDSRTVKLAAILMHKYITSILES